MTVSKDVIFAVMIQAMRTCRERGDVADLFEALTGATIAAAALRPEGVEVLRGCAEVLVDAAAELEQRHGVRAEIRALTEDGQVIAAPLVTTAPGLQGVAQLGNDSASIRSQGPSDGNKN